MKRKPGPIVPIAAYTRIETDRKCVNCNEKPAYFGSYVCTACVSAMRVQGAKQPCKNCGIDTWQKKNCPACGLAVSFIPKAPKAKRELEGPIKKRCRDALIAAGANVWIHDVDNRQMKTGLGLGASDLICIVPPRGRWLAIEMKRPGYSPSDVTAGQRSFLALIRKMGGISGIATCEAEALALLEEARQ